LAATLQTKPVESVAEKPKPAPLPVAPAPAAPFSAAQKPAGTEENAQTAPANSAPTDEPDAALVEAVVQRVLDKMRPQVVEIITKEFLRPVVQALVNREIQKR
jgi:septal ring-binding cell division protein DamX